MKFSFYPKRVLIVFFIGFAWAGISSFHFYLYIKDFYNSNLIRIASSLSQIIAKKIDTKVLNYFLLANNISENLEPFSRSITRNKKDLEDILFAAMNKTPEILKISIILKKDLYPNKSDLPSFMVATRSKNNQIKVEEQPEAWIAQDFSPFILPPGQVSISSPLYDSENQLATMSLIRTLWDPLKEISEPLGFMDVRIPLTFVNHFLSESLGATKGHIILASPEQNFLIGNHFLAEKNLHKELPLLQENQTYASRKIGNQTFLLYKRPIQFLNMPSVGDIYLFLPTTTFLYSSQRSLFLFLTVNMLILSFMFFTFIFFFYWSLKQNLAQEQAYQDIEEESEKDPLTDVYNRVRARKYLETIEREYNAKGTSFCCLLLDIDHFKKVNDDYGHDKGDYVLKRISYLLQLKIRTHDLLSRIGGEEFLIVLKDISLEDAYKRSEFLRKVVVAYEFPFMDRPLTISIGCAYVISGEINNDIINNTQDIIDTADKALYFSKNHGRNQTTLTIVNPRNLESLNTGAK